VNTKITPNICKIVTWRNKKNSKKFPKRKEDKRYKEKRWKQKNLGYESIYKD
jgi:hypothetical protein